MPHHARTITVPHLGGSTIGLEFGQPYNPSLPTLVMINSFTTSVELYRAQFADTDIVANFVFGDGSIAAITFSAKGHAFEGVKERFSAHRGDLERRLDPRPAG